MERPKEAPQRRLLVSKELQRKILFPWDGSPLAEQALGFTTFLASRLGTELTIFRAVLPARADLVAAPDLSGKDLAALAYKQAEKEAAQLCAPVPTRGRRTGKWPLWTLRERSCPTYGRSSKASSPHRSWGGRQSLTSNWLFSAATAPVLRREDPWAALRKIFNGSSRPVLVVPLLPPPPDVMRHGPAGVGDDDERREL